MSRALLDIGKIDKACRWLAGNEHGRTERAIDALQLSARSMHRILRVARTIADLANSPQITTVHLSEALGYRRVDRGVTTLAA